MPSPRPRLALLLCALALLTALSLPTLLGYAEAGPGERFGGFIDQPSDQAQYLAWMREAAGGAWLLGDRYTHEASRPVVLAPFWVLLGRIVGATGAAPDGVYHGARVLLGLLLLLAVYRFCSLWLRQPGDRLAATLLAASAGGLGVPLARLGISPPATWPDAAMYPPGAWWPELHIAQTLELLPHFLFGLWLLLESLIGAVRWARREGDGRREALHALVAAGVLGVAHPMDVGILLAWAVALGLLRLLACSPGQRRREARRLGLGGLALGAAALPGVMAVQELLSSDAVWRAVLAGNDQPTPALWLVAVGLGVPLLGAVAALGDAVTALRQGASERQRAALVGVALLATSLGIAQLPLALQRRLLAGVQVPMALAAVAWASGRRPALRAGILATLLALGAWGTVSDLRRQLDLARTGADVNRAVLYLSPGTRDAFSYLRAHAAPGDVVFCDPRTGILVPAWTDQRAAVGHWAHTLHFEEKAAIWTRFAQASSTPAERLEAARSVGARWILVRVTPPPAPPTAQRGAWTLQALAEALDHLPPLQLVHTNPEFALFKRGLTPPLDI